MSGFELAQTIEARGMIVLLPYLEDKAYKKRFVRTAKGPLAKFLQERVGDVLLNTDEETICAVEIKVERRWTGNLFLETWSNRNLDHKAAHSERGSNPGWLFKTQADVLLSYFLDEDILVAVPVFSLKRWAFVDLRRDGCAGKIWGYQERSQMQYEQLNDTWGRLVAVGVLEKEAGAKRISVRQLSLY